MKKYTFKILTGLALSFVLCANANAALVSMDRNALGDNQITLDTQTGLKWLDLNLSVPLAIAFSNQFTAEGWQVATLDQVQTLINNQFGSSTTNNSRISADPAKTQEFVELFGATFGSEISWGRFQATDANKAGQAIVRYDTGLQSYLIGDNVDSAASPNSFSGVFYVQTVPVPPAMWLFGTGLIGFAAIGRSKKGEPNLSGLNK